jgi:hypothetical protein
VSEVAPRVRRERSDGPILPGPITRRGCSTLDDPQVEHVPVTRLPKVRQRRLMENRTVASAPKMTGLTLTGMSRLVSRYRRCHEFLPHRRNLSASITGTLAAARELSAIPTRNLPNILSAIQVQNPRLVPPYTILGSGKPCNFLAAKRTSLRSDRTMPPQLGNQKLPGGTHSTLPGAIGVGSKTGAAIHEPVVPGESI